MDDQTLTIEEVARGIGAELFGPRETAVTEITHDSRQAAPGSLFVAIKGTTLDGHRFIDDVIRRGAVGIISESEPPKGFTHAWLRVANAREAHSKAAAIVFRNPSRELDLIGITGTNGKTTTTYLCFALAEADAIRPAMLTTVEYRIGEIASRPSVPRLKLPTRTDFSDAQSALVASLPRWKLHRKRSISAAAIISISVSLFLRI